jgi:hypothetical protein
VFPSSPGRTPPRHAPLNAIKEVVLPGLLGNTRASVRQTPVAEQAGFPASGFWLTPRPAMLMLPPQPSYFSVT